jgi:pimeloyl-ACP methyl ester carboxylesterase
MRYPGDVNGTPQDIAAETLLIWGEQDPFLSEKLTHGLERWVPKLHVERIPQASHWVQNEVPDIVNRMLIEFLR